MVSIQFQRHDPVTKIDQVHYNPLNFHTKWENNVQHQGNSPSAAACPLTIRMGRLEENFDKPQSTSSATDGPLYLWLYIRINILKMKIKILTINCKGSSRRYVQDEKGN